jgi:hypothetical protein
MTVLAFPKDPVRALHIAGSAAGGYAASYVGPKPWDGPTGSDVASLALVADAVLDPRNRRGLPIISPPEVIAWAMRGSTKLRPPPQRRPAGPTDQQKYSAALQEQQIRDGRDACRWVPCDDYPRGAA